MIECLIMTLVGLVSGAVMYSYLIGKLFFKVDIRTASGDLNPGSSNAIKTIGVPAGAVCMALDVLKAFVPVFIAVSFVNVRGYYLIPVLAAPVIGHAFSPVLKFDGGKAIAATYGSMLGLMPISRIAFLFAIVMFALRFLVVVRPDSSGTVTSLVIISVITAIFDHSLWLKIAVILISVIVTIKHVQKPDSGDYTVCVWHYSLEINEDGLKFSKT